MQSGTVRPSRALVGVMIGAGSVMVLAARVGGQAAAPAVSAAPTVAAAPAVHAAHGAGIWKAVVPPQPMHGEFDNNDPLGVAAGARVKADCSLNWRDPDDGRLYCFSSGTSLEMFLELPHSQIERARHGWELLTAEKRR